MAEYILYVYCRRDGVSRDAGRHDSCQADDDKTAIRKLVASALGLKRHYDEVSCTIKCGDKVIHECRV